MNDRQLTEVMFCSRLLYLVVIGGMDVPGNEQAYQKIKDLALEVIQDPIRTAHRQRSENLRRRVVRLEQKYMHQYVGKAHGSKVALVLYYFLNDLIERDYLCVPPESPFMELADIVFGAITNSLQPDSPEFTLVAKSAQKQAIKMLKELQKDGYFQD